MSWGHGDGLLSGLFGSLLGGYCRPAIQDDTICCSYRDDGELLTAAWRHTVDTDDTALSELVAQSGGRKAVHPSTSRGVPPVLEVPPEFDLVRLDRFSEAQGTESRTPGEQQQLLQTCLRIFARALLKGIRMSVLLDDGRTLLTEASLDSELTHLVLHMPNVQCPVALRCIEKICSPDEVNSGVVLTTNQAYLDERCTTLVLGGGQFLTFVFEASRSRQYFEMCLKVVILAKGGASLEEANAGPGAGPEESPKEPPSPTASQKSPAPTISVGGSAHEVGDVLPCEETSQSSPTQEGEPAEVHSEAPGGGPESDEYKADKSEA